MSDTENNGKKGLSALRQALSWVGTFLAALAICVLLKTFLIANYVIPSASMEPTIGVGECVVGTRLLGAGPAVGDIVTFADPAGSGTVLIKRVVAMGGQTVELLDGDVYVDGIRSDIAEAHGESEPESDLVFPHTVADGCVWVMGDNREDSADSRTFGDVPVSSVEARALLVYWPLTDVRAL